MLKPVGILDVTLVKAKDVMNTDIWLFCITLCEKKAWANQTQHDKEEFIASSLEWRVQARGEENLVIITYLSYTTEGKTLEIPEFSTFLKL